MASKASEFVIAYDANCGPCSRFKAVVEFFDPHRRITFASLEAADQSGLLAGIAPARRYASFHLIRPAHEDVRHAEALSGSDALLPLVRLLSPGGFGISSAIEAMPGGMAGASFVYFTLSRLHRDCRVPPASDHPTGRRPEHRGGFR